MMKKNRLLMIGNDTPQSNLVNEDQDLDVEKEIIIYITHGNSILI
jgi:hypothetical protein